MEMMMEMEMMDESHLAFRLVEAGGGRCGCM